MLQDSIILPLENITNSWVVDLGALFHAMTHKKYYQDYVQGDFRKVHLGDDKPCNIVGKGKVKIKL